MLENSIKPFLLLLVLLVFLVLCRVPILRQDNETDFTQKSSSQVRPPSAAAHTFRGDHTHTFAGDCVRCQSTLDSANSATGTVFSNERKRQYTGSRAAFSEIRLNFLIADQNRNCSKWGVVTTIFNPTIAIVRVALLPSWCMVIVPDLNTPTDYMDKLHALLPTNNNSNTTHMNSILVKVFYFSVEMQREWQSFKGPIGSFVKSVPWEHFSRKNLGYLYAIAHGAHFIFDFDDDNILKVDSNGHPLQLLPLHNDASGMKLNVSIVMQGSNAFNHHPIMGSSISNSWARGFPLELLQDRSTQGEIAYQSEVPFVGKTMEVGVLQFLADGDPDVDAIHRLTKPLPMSFNNKGTPMLVPAHAYTALIMRRLPSTQRMHFGQRCCLVLLRVECRTFGDLILLSVSLPTLDYELCFHHLPSSRYDMNTIILEISRQKFLCTKGPAL